MLSNKPSLILAYEATGSMVNTAGRESFTLLRHIVEQETLSLLISSLNPKVELFFDSLLQLQHG